MPSRLRRLSDFAKRIRAVPAKVIKIKAQAAEAADSSARAVQPYPLFNPKQYPDGVLDRRAST